MAKVLKLEFGMPDNKKMTWTLADPKQNLTAASVKSTCDAILMKSGILVGNVEPDKFNRAYIYETNTIELT